MLILTQIYEIKENLALLAQVQQLAVETLHEILFNLCGGSVSEGMSQMLEPLMEKALDKVALDGIDEELLSPSARC